MKTTFENMDKLKDDLFKAIETICKDYEEKPGPEFKEGEWGAYNDGGIIYPFLIHHVENSDVYGQDFSDPDDLYKVDTMCVVKNLIHPTKGQIESHLIKICKERYLGKKVKCLIEGEYYLIATGNCVYYSDDKLYMMYSNTGFPLCVYQQGKFAEIIPDKKKKPETRGEFKQFLEDWAFLPCFTYDEFLDQYDIS